ncbi:trehalase-like isoform X2 [Eupeodes corollae]|uniref:trehalase-like isoform X2 n=1 Tax=Eupeodes corollae TaxID=290404 RepID=UPI002490F974|nr:trehalase-like isoform X2 [Eupeodes corollae]XP_055908703.1 trehalase-like isoform X2 [Eupeodes corollae]
MISSRTLLLGVFCVFQLLVSRPLLIQSAAIAPDGLPEAGTVYLEACEVYCTGKLLHHVQMNSIFKDSKTFVDMKLKNSPNVTITKFEELLNSKDQNPSKTDIEQFVKDNFDDLGKEFENYTPQDWIERPRFLDLIRDPDLKQWGSELNGIWKILGRKMIDDVHKNPEYYSIIPVDNPVIVPGGRFIEFYYWDSYWIIRGLLHSQMDQTARGMLSNFLSIVQRFGFIPNGGRVYYAKRSQPPLLAGMIKSYVEFTKDDEFALNSVETLEHEFEYWMNNHTVQAKGYNLFAYGDSSVGPRPESYREDVISARRYDTDEKKQAFYSELAAAAESGMDFSSRWFINDKGTNEGNLTDLKCRSIIPVELNAILYWNAKIIAEFYTMSNNVAKSSEYETKAKNILEAINAVLWNEEAGVWLDYDMLNNKPRNYFTPTNLFPLWTKAFNPKDSEKISKTVLKYIAKLELDKYPGGVPNTLSNTGEQWDYPNVWPPMQHTLLEGLANLKTPEATKLAKSWSFRWVRSNFAAFKETQAMFEKYDAEKFGGHGGGGEYDIQTGFGWTNGIIIDLLTKYGDEITPAPTSKGSITSMMSLVAVAAVAVIVTTVGRFLW